MQTLNTKTDNKTQIHNHVVKIPKTLANFDKKHVGAMIYNLMNNIHQIDKLKLEVSKEEYTDQTQVRIQINQQFQDVLNFLCKNEKMTIRQTIILSLILANRKSHDLLDDNTG